MGCKFSFKRVALVATLALAGLFVVTATITNNKSNNEQIVKTKAQLDPTGKYRYVLFANCHSTWAKNDVGTDYLIVNMPKTIADAEAHSSEKNYAIWYSYWCDGEDNNTKNGRLTPITEENCDIITGFDIRNEAGSSVSYSNRAIVRLKIPVKDETGTKNVAYIKFSGRKTFEWGNGWWEQTSSYTIPTSGDNLLIVASSGGGPTRYNDVKAYWTIPLSTSPSYSGDTETLLFAPNYNWSTWTCYYDEQYYQLYPTIYYQWFDKGIIWQNANWPGKRWDEVGSLSNGIYSFNNVPLEEFRQLSILFNNNVSSGTIPRLDFHSTSRDEWWDGTEQTKNLFGMPYNSSNVNYVYSTDTYTTMTSDYYDIGTNAIITGSFLLDTTSSWNTGFSTAHRLVGSSSSYTYTADVVTNDQFKYVLNALNNTSTSGSDSSYNLNGNGSSDYKGYNTTNVKVYSGDETNQITNASEYATYLSNGDDGNIVFRRSGRVTFKRVTTDATNLELRVIFLNHTYDNADCYLIGAGSFVSGNHYNWSTGSGLRFKTIGSYSVLSDVYLEAGDCFQIYNDTYRGYNKLVGKGITISDYFGEAHKNLYRIAGTGSEAWYNDTPPIEAFDYENVNGGSGDIRVDGKHDIYVKAPQWWYKNNFDYMRCHYWSPDANINTTEVVGEFAEGNEKYKIFKVNEPLPEGKSGYQFWRAGTDGQTKYTGEVDTLVGNNNIVVKKSGHYHIYVDGSNNINVSLVDLVNEFKYGDSVYLDLGSSSWADGSAIIGARFYRDDATKNTVYTDVIGTTVDFDYNNTTVYEIKIPELSNSTNPCYVVFWRVNPGDARDADPQDGTWWILLPSDGKYHKVWTQITDLGFATGQNVYQLTGWTTGNWTYYFTNLQRAEHFGYYMNSLTNDVCDSDGFTDIEELKAAWASSKEKYDQMCNYAQGKAWLAVGKEDGSYIEEAMARYDYIVFARQYHNLIVEDQVDKTDFIQRGNSGSGRIVAAGMVSKGYMFGLINDSNPIAAIIIIVVSSLSIVSISSLSIVVVKKRKSRQSN